MSDTLVILGAGGHAKVCYEIAVEMGIWTDYVILDDNPKNNFFEITGKLMEFNNYPNADFFVAIGTNEVRKNWLTQIHDNKLPIVTLIHPSSIISPSVKLGHGTVVMPGVVINAGTDIGQGCIINTACSIDHDDIIGSFVHISPGARLAGSVTVGDLTWVGINSTIINDINICSHVQIGGGSVVTTDISSKGTYVGNPMRRIS